MEIEMLKVKSVYAASFRDLAFDVDGHVVVCETPFGEAYMHFRRDLTEQQAESLARRVEAAGRIDEAHWSFWRTIYGTQAFLSEEADLHFYLGGGAREEDLPDYLRVLA
jgi:hypothetical protein